eukprot:GHVL01021241.1.p1 GENE.GHVL01021241.1~~GHVL01021241.1.p1  ORF type:complete len:219 (+),score=43.61 GHVL01021241.1:41-658(+)
MAVKNINFQILPRKPKPKPAIEHFCNEGEDPELDDLEYLYNKAAFRPARLLDSNFDVSNKFKLQGEYYADNNRFRDAIREWQKAVALVPSGVVWEEISQGFMALGDDFLAIKAAERSVELSPDWISFRSLGRALLNFGEIDLSKKYFIKSIKLNKEDEESKISLRDIENIQKRASDCKSIGSNFLVNRRMYGHFHFWETSLLPPP